MTLSTSLAFMEAQLKQIIDQVTGKTVSISLVGNTATMCHGTIWLTETIRPADISLAKIALSKRDLNSFGSFFDRSGNVERKVA